MKPFTLILLFIACAPSAVAQPSAELEKDVHGVFPGREVL